jgi:hypothetical protein
MSGECRVRCEICSLGSLWDIDSRSGYISGNLNFGPANAEGGVLTYGVQGFFVYFATSCNEKIGGPVAFVNSNSSEPRACCKDDLYLAVLDGLAIPPNASKLLVSINTTSAGELPLGVAADLVDRAWNYTPPPEGILATVQQASGRRSTGGRQTWHIVAMMAAYFAVNGAAL